MWWIMLMSCLKGLRGSTIVWCIQKLRMITSRFRMPSSSIGIRAEGNCRLKKLLTASIIRPSESVDSVRKKIYWPLVP